jgi:putative DNA primase/helicase
VTAVLPAVETPPDSKPQAAAWWAEHGRRVLPLCWTIRESDRLHCSCRKGTECEHLGKHPLTEHGVSEATSDLRQVEWWWRRWPMANIGVALDNEVVVDLDPRHSLLDTAEQMVAALADQGRSLARAPWHRTGGQGLHVPYRTPEDTPAERFNAKRIDGLAVQLKAGPGAYIVVPPSVTEGPYEAIAGSLHNLTEAPDWLIEFAKPSSNGQGAGAGSARLDLATMFEGVPEGKRDDEFWRYASSLRGRNVHIEEARALVEAAWQRADPGNHPFPLEKALEKVNRAYTRYEPNESDTEEGPIFPAPSNPLAVARQLIEADQLRDVDGNLLVRWWRGAFQFWTGSHWAEVAKPAIQARLYEALEHARWWKPKKDESLELVPWAPTRHKIGDLYEALQSIVHLDERTEPPAWLVGGNDGGEFVAMRNGLLHLGSRTLTDHTPLFFNQTALPYDWEAEPGEPVRWLEFLGQLWPDDDESVALLQEWFGYAVSGATNLHKVLGLFGPPRSGKGTIARVLTALVGRNNVAGPTLASLGTNFGLQPLLGKSLAIVSDARLGTANPGAVVERLLSISGEDALTVDVKYREPWTGRLGARFVVISNELPNLGDASGAVATRFLVLSLTESWLGHEDPTLTDKLLEELPAILAWSLEGLDRLRERGHFTEPKASRDAVMALAELASPVSAFVGEWCEREPGFAAPVQRVYQAWRLWCAERGRKATSDQVFGRDLRAAVPGLKRTQEGGRHERRTWQYEGLRLRADAEARVTEEEEKWANGNPK